MAWVANDPSTETLGLGIGSWTNVLQEVPGGALGSMVGHASLLISLLALQTDWGVRTPPGELTTVQESRASATEPKGSFSCSVRYVTDGDTFRCADGTRVRLSSIDTPEMPGSCRPGRSCAPGDPYAAKATLERLIGGQTVHCEPVGMSYNRIAAWCSVGGVDLSCAMVRSGHAIRLSQYDRRGRLCR
jgi:endonuclease YncB( thermonuclease family)